MTLDRLKSGEVGTKSGTKFERGRGLIGETHPKMDVAFVVGLSLELAGATLLATGVLVARSREVASRGHLYVTSGVPQRSFQ